MKVKTALYTIEIPGGFYAEMSPFVKSIHDENPDSQITADDYTWEYRMPKVFVGRSEEWKEIVANRKTDPSLATLYPFRRELQLRIDETELINYAEGLKDGLKILKTEVVNVEIPSFAAQDSVEQQLNLFKQIGELSAQTLDKLKDCQDHYERFVSKFGGEHMVGDDFNLRCGQIQPNVGLWNFNELMLLEDSCTDQLQDYLDAGWRMLAIQPQPTQRRPDYILGRYNMTRTSKSESGALRG